MKKNLILVNGSTLFVYALLDQAGGSNVFTVTILLSCCMVSFLLWFAYLFQYTTEQVRMSVPELISHLSEQIDGI